LSPVKLLSQNRKSLRWEAYETRILGGDKMAITAGFATSARASSARASEATRWGQLVFGIVCMVMIANLQYGSLCQSDRSEISLGPRGDPSRLHDLRAGRDLAGAVRGLPDRQVRAKGHGLRLRRFGRDRLGHQFDGRLPLPALCGRRDRRHWGRRHIWRFGRQCAEVGSPIGADSQLA
jgi:hypothetical protein